MDLAPFASSVLTGAGEVPKDRPPRGADIPVTYVPARNLIFLSCAAAWAESLGARDIFIGVSSVDYSGYPDCRPDFIDSFQRTVNVATKAGVEGEDITVHAPFLEMSKADVVRRGRELGIDYSLTHSCYDPEPGGGACGRCDSCLIRRKAFEEA
jgi:7-cyano-7-deazaguanine synthase